MKKLVIFFLAIVVLLTGCQSIPVSPTPDNAEKSPTATNSIPSSTPTVEKVVITETATPVVTDEPEATETPERVASIYDAYPEEFPKPLGVGILERVDDTLINEVFDYLLGLDLGFEDPRVSCDSLSGFNMALADSGLCLPRQSDVGFCMPESEDYPCDRYLMVVSGVSLQEGYPNLGGRAIGYTILFVDQGGRTVLMRDGGLYVSDLEQTYFQFPYLTSIPMSSAFTDLMQDFGIPVATDWE